MTNKCCCCDTELTHGMEPWHWICINCKYECADFIPSINETTKHYLVNEDEREKGLRSIRSRNFQRLLSLILSYLPQGKHTLLDIGAAHGWFVSMASEYFQALGIEPDQVMYQQAVARGVNMRKGYFPDVLSDKCLFDVIVFNDVFEHFPNVKNTLSDCNKYLSSNGLLVLNLPSSDGFFYRVSKILAKFGFSGPFERMWQKELPSPHIHYFNRNNLVSFLENNGFSEVCHAELKSIQLEGLYKRISYVKGSTKLTNLFIFVLSCLAIPFTKIFNNDIMVIIAKKASR